MMSGGEHDYSAASGIGLSAAWQGLDELSVEMTWITAEMAEAGPLTGTLGRFRMVAAKRGHVACSFTVLISITVASVECSQ